MKRFIKPILIVIGILVFLVIAFVAFLNFKSLPSYESIEIPDLQVESSQERLELGKVLTDHMCAGCHRGPARQYEGQVFPDQNANKTFGTIYVSNITQDNEFGIGNYTDGELYRLLRTGVKKNHQLSVPIMPRLALIDDEDIYAMIAYLRSDDPQVQPSKKDYPVFKPSLLAKGLLSFAIKPIPYEDQYPQKPPKTDALAYGEYLVNASMGCFHCHSESIESVSNDDPKSSPGYLGGGTEFVFPEHSIITPSILMDGVSNISSWSKDQFIGAVKFGQRAGQPAYLPPMHPYPMLDSMEVGAIYDYLKAYSSSQ